MCIDKKKTFLIDFFLVRFRVAEKKKLFLKRISAQKTEKKISETWMKKMVDLFQ